MKKWDWSQAILLCLFCLFAYVIKKNIPIVNLKSSAGDEVITKSSTITKKDADLQNSPRCNTGKNQAYLLSKNIEKIKSEKPTTGHFLDIAQTKYSPSLTNLARIDTFNLNEFAKSKINESFAMDLRSAVPFGNWKEGELASLSGKFFGNGTGTASNYQVRINLLETIDTSNLSPSSCVGFYNNSQVVFKESVEGGRIKILRTPTFGYIILVVSNNFYVQLFQTRENGRRQIEVHITKEENKRPVVMKAKQIRNSYADDCGLYY